MALKTAGTNRPAGFRFNRIIGQWLRENGFDGINNQERYRALLVIENLPAISAWRDGLAEAKARRLNHPNAVWAHWQRSIKPVAPAPCRQPVDPQDVAHAVTAAAAVARSGKPIHWSQDAMRRAHKAMLASQSTDLLVLARCALQAAIRSESDLIELLRPDAAAMSALPRRADVVSRAG